MDEKPEKLRRMTSGQATDALFARAIQVLQNPLYDPEGEDFKVITSVLKSCDFFQKNFKSPAKLNEFLQLAKFHLNYEHHNYGSVLIKEKDYADRFYFILQGNVQKFHQRPSYDVDHEVKEEKQRKQRKQISGRRPSHARKSILSHLKVAKANSIRRSKRFSRIAPSSPSTGNNGTSGFTSRSSKLYTEEGSPKHHVPSIFAKRKKSSKLSTSPKSPYKSPAKSPLKTSDNSPARRRSSIRKSSGLTAPKMADRIRLTINTGLRTSIFQKEKVASPAKSRKSNSRSPSLKSDNSPLSPYSKDSIVGMKTNKRPTALHLKPLKSPKVLHAEAMDEANDGPTCSSPYTRIPKEEARLIRFIASRNRDIQHRCLYENAIRLAKINTFNRGDFFGENFNKVFQPKETSILAVSSTECHLLSLTRESYQLIISELEKKANDKLQLFLNLFPTFDREVVLNFSQYFVEQSFQVDEVIYRESDPTKDLYLLLSGNVKLLSGMKGLKSTEDSSDHQGSTTLPTLHNEIKIPVVSVIKNQFFGEEVLLESEFRQFTAVANSPNTFVYYLEIALYEKMKKEYESLFEVLKSQAYEKFAWRQYKSIEAFQKKSLETSPTKPILAYTSKPIYSPTGFSYIMPWRDNPSKKRNFSEASMSLSLRASDAEPQGGPGTPGKGGFFATPRADQKSIFTATTSPKNGAFETMYKQKFSRAHVPAVRQAHLTVIGSPKKGEIGGVMPVKFDIEEFNVRKELGLSKSHRAFAGKELLDVGKKNGSKNEFLSSYRSPNSTVMTYGGKPGEVRSPSLANALRDLVLPPGIQALKNKGMKVAEKSVKLNKIKVNSISVNVNYELSSEKKKASASARKKNDMQLLTIYSFPKVAQGK